MVFINKYTVHSGKIAKMRGVTLRYTWNTWAICVGPGLESCPPIREAIFKKCIHIIWIGLPGR